MRSTRFRSSRTFPGQGIACRVFSASGEKVLLCPENSARNAAARTGMSSRRSLRGGRRRGKTLSRWNRSSRNVPLPDFGFKIPVRGDDHADVDIDMMRRTDPMESPFLQNPEEPGLEVQGHGGDLVEEQCPAIGEFELPGSAVSAPVYAPRSCPKSSASASVGGMAPQLTATNGFSARGLWRWMAQATSSFPVPVSPVMSTVAWEGATRAMRSVISCIWGLMTRDPSLVLEVDRRSFQPCVVEGEVFEQPGTFDGSRRKRCRAGDELCRSSSLKGALACKLGEVEDADHGIVTEQWHGEEGPELLLVIRRRIEAELAENVVGDQRLLFARTHPAAMVLMPWSIPPSCASELRASVRTDSAWTEREDQNGCMVRMGELCTPLGDEIQGVVDGVPGAEGYRKSLELLKVLDSPLQLTSISSVLGVHGTLLGSHLVDRVPQRSGSCSAHLLARGSEIPVQPVKCLLV